MLLVKKNIYITVLLASVFFCVNPSYLSAQTAQEEMQTDLSSNEVIQANAEVAPALEEAPIPEVPQELTVDIKALQILLNDEHTHGVDWEAIVSNYVRAQFEGLKIFQAIQDTSRLDAGILTAEDFNILLGALKLVGIEENIFNGRNNLTFGKPLDITVKPLEVFFVSNDGTSEDAEDRSGKIKINLNAEKSVEENRLQVTIDPQVLLDSETGMIPSPYVESTRLQRMGTTIRSFIPFAENDQVRNARNERVDESGMIYNAKAAGKNRAVFLTTKEKTKIDITPGSTVVLGGILKEVVVDSTRKIPLLGDIPLLGFVFRNEGQRIRKSEIIIFITPKLNNSDEHGQKNK